MSDSILKQDVIDALEDEPGLDARHIAVTVDDGTVTLSGFVRRYAQKCAAATAVQRLRGLRALAQEIEVRPEGTHLTADDEIARRAAEVLRWHATVPREAVRVTVEDGWITLTGTVGWNVERSAAEVAVRPLIGVRGVLNQIRLAPAASAVDIRQRIVALLRRDADLEAGRITVEVADHQVTLEGKVRTWAEREAAARVAWSAPGVTGLVNRLEIGG